MKKYNKNKSGRHGLENLEDRKLFSSVGIHGAALELRGDSNQANTFLVRAATDNRVLGFANNFGEVASLNTVDEVIIYTGDKTDTVTVAHGVNAPVEVISANGQVTWLKAGESKTFNGAASTNNDSSNTNSNTSNTGSSSTGTGSSSTGTGSSSTGTGSSSTGTGSSSTGTGSSSTGTGSSSTGTGSSSTGTGSSSTGTGSSSTGTGSSSTGTGSSSTGTGSSSTGTGSSSTGTGSSSTGTGSSSTGTGSSSTGTGSSSTGTGASSTGTGTTPVGSGSGTGTTSTPSDPSDSATPTAVITVTSPSTVLPYESVNVQALASNFGSGTSLNDIIAWNFGDPTAAYNNLRGFNAAHSYTTAGTYTITLTITTPDGHVGVATTQITVSPDTRQTIYVSTSGSDSNNGLTAATAVQTLAKAQSLMTSNTRVLLEAGDTWTFDNLNVLNAAGMQHVYIGSYGTGAQPILNYDGPAVQGPIIGMSSTTEGLVVNGLTITSTFANADDKIAFPSGFFPIGNDITIMNNTFLNCLNDMNMQGGPTNVLVQGNTSPNPTGLNAYFCWVQGANIAIIGNTVSDSAGEAIIRVGGENNLLIADNNLTKQRDNGDKNVLSIQAGTYTYVYNNILQDGPTSVGPIGVSSSDPNVDFEYAVFDSNTIVDNNFLMQPGAHNIMYRNNVIEADGNTGFTINGQEVSGNFDWQVQNVWIQNNTVIDSGQWGGFLTISNGEAQNVHVLNNLFVDPTFETGFGEGFIVDNNGDMNSFAEIANNVWSVPSQVSSFAQGGYFFVGSDPSNPAGWLTPAEWEATGIPTGDVYQNVQLGATYSVEVNGFTAGSNLPTAST